MKNNEKLPILVSVPHGGDKAPLEVKNNIKLSYQDIFDDIDPYTKVIYDLKNLVKYQISTDIARTFIDLNRSRNELPPENPDGVIKTVTCYNNQIYYENLNSKIINTLINKYYIPYHNKINEICNNKKTEIAFDCHSMAETGPDFSLNPGEPRPLFCISNNLGKTCPDSYLEELSKIIAKIFSFDSVDITVNQPFKGGFIARYWGNNPIPWIQIEINRKLYLNDQYFDSSAKTVKPERLKYLNKKMNEVIKNFYYMVFG